MFKFVTRRKLIKQINHILQFERDQAEFFKRPPTQAAKDFWMKEWYDKAKAINALINGGKNNGDQ